MKNDPSFRPPVEYQQQKRSQRPSDKVYIPVKEFPEINFFGLLVGPRGNSLKKMERESGAKISIRGKGSVKEGKSRPDAYADDAEEDLHCLILAENDEKVAACVRMINRVIETVIISSWYSRPVRSQLDRLHPPLKAKMTTSAINYASSLHSTVHYEMTRTKYAKTAVASVTANSTARSRRISRPTSFVAFVVALATWLVIAKSTKTQPWLDREETSVVMKERGTPLWTCSVTAALAASTTNMRSFWLSSARMSRIPTKLGTLQVPRPVYRPQVPTFLPGGAPNIG